MKSELCPACGRPIEGGRRRDRCLASMEVDGTIFDCDEHVVDFDVREYLAMRKMRLEKR